MTFRFFSALLLVGFSFGSVHAQNFNKPKIDSLFDALAQYNKAMGCLALSKNGKLLYNRAIGYSYFSSEKNNSAANESSEYRIGSVSKMFTATIVFQLIEEGKLSLKTPLKKYFPKLPNAEKITVGNLLNHHSGLHDFTNDTDYVSWMTKPKTEAEMLTIIANGGVDFKPGEKGKYCNSNYVILGYLIEKICKQPYKTVVQNRIVSKLGLNNTYVGGKTNPAENECYSYVRIGNWKELPETDMSITGGAGAILSTPKELVTFIEALFSLKLISKESLSQMMTITDGYGMGIFRETFNDKVQYGHTGAIDGFVTILYYLPGDSLTLAYTTNGQEYPVENIITGILNICYNLPYSIPNFKGLSLKPEELDKYLGVYTTKDAPMEITITKDSATLYAQATGQMAFPLNAVETNMFEFELAKIKLLFDPARNEMILKQRGIDVLYTKKE